MFKNNKKAAATEPSAGNAAVVVIIIAGIIIAYILGVSPSERAKILGDSLNSSAEGSNPSGSQQNTVLLQENIGQISNLPYSEKIHQLSTITVSSKTSAQVIASNPSMYVRNSVFTKIFPKLRFDIDPELTNNLKLSFTLTKATGIIYIYLNGHEVFSGSIKHSTPPAISLPKEYINDQNELLFYIYRPSWAFWQINEYELKDVKVLGNVKDVSNSRADISFYISRLEKQNIGSAKLFFVPDCSIDSVGKLDIYLNSARVFSGIPDCQLQNFVIIDPDFLIAGRNVLSFKTSKGSYLLSLIKLKTELKEQTYPISYFDMQDSYFYSSEDYEEDDNPSYHYYCDESGNGIVLSYDDEQEITGWLCDENQNCIGNFRYYDSQKPENFIRSALCEHLQSNEYKYQCGEDKKSIFLKTSSSFADTGWNCPSGKTCENKFKIYDHERMPAIVKQDLCYYKDSEAGNLNNLKQDYKVILTLRFPDNDFKELTLWINGYKKYVSTQKTMYSVDISDYVLPGSNSVELVPRTNNIAVSELKVVLKNN